MFNLFKKSAAPEERLAACLAKKDYPGLARAYYDMGKAAMEAGDPGRAMLWLIRRRHIRGIGGKTHRRLLKPDRRAGGGSPAVQPDCGGGRG